MPLATAAGLVAEIGDFTRFQRAPQLMSWVDLVPSEYSSGPQRRQGAITRAGSGHARRLLLIEFLGDVVAYQEW